MPKITELPNDILREISEKALIEMEKRGLRGAPPREISLDLDPIYQAHLQKMRARVACMRRHPFAQQSDVDAILKWEASLPKPDPLGDALAVPCAAPEAKPALPNAMVVRGGHDEAGWVK